jgi:hypothetical protein
MRKIRPWELVFYVSMATILIWLILKLTGIINTPPFLQYGLPGISVLLAFFALYRDISDKINRIGNGVTKLFVKLDYIEKDVEGLKSKKR